PSYEWVHGAKRTAVEVTAFVSRADANLAVIRLRLVPQYGGRVTVRFPLRAWPRPRRLALARLERSESQWTLDSVWYPAHLVATAADSLSILARAEGGTTRVAVAQQLTWSARLRNPRQRGTEVSFDVAPAIRSHSRNSWASRRPVTRPIHWPGHAPWCGAPRRAATARSPPSIRPPGTACGRRTS